MAPSAPKNTYKNLGAHLLAVWVCGEGGSSKIQKQKKGEGSYCRPPLPPSTAIVTPASATRR